MGACRGRTIPHTTPPRLTPGLFLGNVPVRTGVSGRPRISRSFASRFVIAIATELLTGQGVMQQLGALLPQ